MSELISLSFQNVEYRLLKKVFLKNPPSVSAAAAPLLAVASLELIFVMVCSLFLGRFWVALPVTLVYLTAILAYFYHRIKLAMRPQIRDEIAGRMKNLGKMQDVFRDSFARISFQLNFCLQISSLIILPVAMTTLTALSLGSILALFLEFLTIFCVCFAMVYFMIFRKLPQPELLDLKNFKENNAVDLPLLLFLTLPFFAILLVILLFCKVHLLLALIIDIASSAVFATAIHFLLRYFGLYSKTRRRVFFYKVQAKAIDIQEDLSALAVVLKFYKKYALPINTFIISFILLEIFAKDFLKGRSNILFIVQMLTLAASYPIFSNFRRYDDKSKRQFICAVCADLLAIILFMISPIRLSALCDNLPQLVKDVITPITGLVDKILINADNLKNFTSYWKILLPIPAFFAVYFLSFVGLQILHLLEKFSFYTSKKELSGELPVILFNSNLSLYPVLFYAITSFAGLLLLYIEIPFISNLLFTLIGTLQVEEVFKITLFSLENITKFFKAVIFLWTAWCALQILLRFNLAMFSHFILLQNEVIFIRNNLIHRETFRIPLSKIDQVYSQQNAIERFLDIGSISLKTRENDNAVIIPGVIGVCEKNRVLMDKIKIDLQKTK
jgi:hypothetical protein